ncbi:IPT/TIG domain-containing protein [Streptomyces anandii]|uniref:IPT/TIG domain-containing protein n=1 Tax=Streptomyces anandii TaxID=285454 RepID=A0ABW6HGK3_9ACTN
MTGLSSSRGPLYGGSVVAVTGRNLATTDLVTVGDNPARFSVVSDTQIAVVIPAGTATGTVPFTVTTEGGTATAATGYTYT